MAEMTLEQAEQTVANPMLCGNQACSCGSNLMAAGRAVLTELTRLRQRLATWRTASDTADWRVEVDRAERAEARVKELEAELSQRGEQYIELRLKAERRATAAEQRAQAAEADAKRSEDRLIFREEETDQLIKAAEETVRKLREALRRGHHKLLVYGRCFPDDKELHKTLIPLWESLLTVAPTERAPELALADHQFVNDGTWRCSVCGRPASEHPPCA